MRKVVVLLVLALSGCSAVQFSIKDKPFLASKEQTQLDDLQCSNLSQTSGPWLFGIGTLLYRAMAANSYRDCMAHKGYTVEEI